MSATVGSNAAISTWIPSLNYFMNLKGGLNSASDIEIYLNISELKSLCALIGPQGVRIIDSVLLKIVVVKVRIFCIE
jgi:hypothetical protein